MYTNKSIRLHSKCLEILECIQKANRRIDEKKLCLKDYDRAQSFDIIRLMTTRNQITDRIERDKAIRERLITAYVNHMASVVEESIIRCYPVGPETKLQTAQIYQP